MTDRSKLLNTGTTRAYLVLDRSGSMSSVVDDTIGGVNTWKNELATTDPTTRVTIVLFDNEYDVIYDDVPVADIPDFDRSTYVPRGSTALLDAVNKALMLADSKKKEGDRVLFVTATDGKNNASREVTSPGVIKKLIDDRTNSGQYTFVFLNASPDSFYGQSMGFSQDSTLMYAAGNKDQTKQAFKTLTRSSVAYSSQASPQSLNFFEGENTDLREDDSETKKEVQWVTSRSR